MKSWPWLQGVPGPVIHLVPVLWPSGAFACPVGRLVLGPSAGCLLSRQLSDSWSCRLSESRPVPVQSQLHLPGVTGPVPGPVVCLVPGPIPSPVGHLVPRPVTCLCLGRFPCGPSQSCNGSQSRSRPHHLFGSRTRSWSRWLSASWTRSWSHRRSGLHPIGHLVSGPINNVSLSRFPCSPRWSWLWMQVVPGLIFRLVPGPVSGPTGDGQLHSRTKSSASLQPSSSCAMLAIMKLSLPLEAQS